MENINERLLALRKLMAQSHIDAYIITSSDYHDSEYPSARFKTREFMSGFTGSAGTLVVTFCEAMLWTDARYFIQAEEQLEGSDITLCRMGEKGVPSLSEYLVAVLPNCGVIGVDGRTVTASFVRTLLNTLSEKDVTIESKRDLAGEIWSDRPGYSNEPVYWLDERYTGMSTAQKLSKVRERMKQAHAEVHIITTLDDIAWLFNFRGGDVVNNPVALAYAIIEHARAYLFMDAKKLTDSAPLEALGVTLLPYEAIYDFVTRYDESISVLLYSKRVNHALFDILNQKAHIVDAPNPTMLMKAIKNPVETANLREAHIKDGIAVSRFIHRVKSTVGKEYMTELSAAAELEALRTAQGMIEPSFSTICGFGAHGAIVHYNADERSDTQILPDELLLVDSGGQYYEGTTDVTRTITTGSISAAQKRDFTLVLRGMLNLAFARFPYGVSGADIDALARIPLWEAGLDYNHGTGHGIGYMLNVHEGPQLINLHKRESASCVLEAGMMLSDEPGYYIKGSHGVRIENQLIIKDFCTNDCGRFLCFEILTMVPIDLDAIDVSLMSNIDIQRLNAYHEAVYNTLSPRMDAQERVWLKHYTRPFL